MLSIDNKTFMNLQEAVGWLLENNALPFQSTANYVGNTEIAMSTLINPSPAKVRVGSIIFFADSKVSTVIGVTSNSFIVSDQYNDLVDDIVYVSNVAINASGHLIVTLSNGTDIDAGLIKQVTNFSINGSQHLIANYNDGTNTDLGAIFNGNVSITGNLRADYLKTLSSSEDLSESFTLNVSDLSAISPDLTSKVIFAYKRVSNGKLSIVVQIGVENNGATSVTIPQGTSLLANDNAIPIPTAVGLKLYGAGPSPTFLGVLDTFAGVKGMPYIVATGAFETSTPNIELYQGNLSKSYNDRLFIQRSPKTSEAVTLGAGIGISWRKEFNFILN